MEIFSATCPKYTQTHIHNYIFKLCVCVCTQKRKKEICRNIMRSKSLVLIFFYIFCIFQVKKNQHPLQSLSLYRLTQLHFLFLCPINLLNFSPVLVTFLGISLMTDMMFIDYLLKMLCFIFKKMHLKRQF